MVFAIDFNKTTGSFDTESEKKKQHDDDSLYLSGSFDTKQSKVQDRLPASESKKHENSSVNEITGSFK